jgi:hypothetical protein
MQPASPNEYGVYTDGLHEVVARHGRAYAAITIALCDDRLYRFGMHLSYSYGGFGCPIFHVAPGYPTMAAARIAALEALLRRWHQPFPSDPQTVHHELAEMRRQIEAQLAQPSLF